LREKELEKRGDATSAARGTILIDEQSGKNSQVDGM
jgi:hypothetical protein